MCNYYAIEQTPGTSPSSLDQSRFAYLDDETVQKQLLSFSDGKTAAVTLSLPSIHCSSCIWLLEQLYKLDSGIVNSRVDFLKKIVTIQFQVQKTSLKNIVILLSSIGYEPELNLSTSRGTVESDLTRSLYYKIGIAGFCFGNSMLFSFPEYLGFDATEEYLQTVFSYLNLLLGLPVFLYCSNGYFSSAWNGIRKKVVNIDVPISLGIIILFGRSAYEIMSHTGPGFIDSLCGLLFFLLLGRIFQSKTYDRLNFERNYQSYFPISVTVKRNGIESSVPISLLKKGNRMVIRHKEIIPADAMLLQGNASIDYSFVTGESTPVEKVLGEIIYAGGRQTGGIIELEVMKEVSQSYLTQLWNNFNRSPEEKGELSELSNRISKYFTIVVFALSAAVFAYWLPKNVTTAVNAVTGIMIVVCPCALAISIPFTLGTAMRIFGRNSFFVKNSAVIEQLRTIDAVVFDKTGTITHPQQSTVEYIGEPLNDEERDALYSVVSTSTHPISGMIARILAGTQYEVDNFNEHVGRGLSGIVRSRKVRVGSKDYVGAVDGKKGTVNETRSYVSIDGKVKGYYLFKNVYREGLDQLLKYLGKNMSVAVVSGDNESERMRLQAMFPHGTELRFNQSPLDKLDYVKSLQSQGKRVLMVGDGLNDAGALMQSTIGIAVTENVANFSPASDAILHGSSFFRFAHFLQFASTSMKIVIASFVMAFLYNMVGLYFALQGILTPIMAAILMPLSSITIVVFTTVTTRFIAHYRGLMPWR